jgi:hypothetical protein
VGHTIVVTSGSGLVADTAKGVCKEVCKEGTMHEEMPMTDDGSVEGDACEQIPNIFEKGNRVLTESEDSDNKDQVYNL